jgi:hypothetical protein
VVIICYSSKKFAPVFEIGLRELPGMISPVQSLSALVHKHANTFHAHFECGSWLPLSWREASFARIPSAQQAALSASKLAYSK